MFIVGFKVSSLFFIFDKYLYIIYRDRLIGLVGRVLANRPEDMRSIPSRVIPKTLKMVLGASLLNTQRYKVRIKGKSGAIQGKELRPPLHLGVEAIEKGAFWSPSTTVANITIYMRWFIFSCDLVSL